MRRSSWKGFLCGTFVLAAGIPCCAQTSLPQQDGFPVLNATGRYLGYGWSRRGYHAQGNGQLRVVRSNHPASRYSSSSLSYPYQPGYRPQTNHPTQQPVLQAPTFAPAPPSIGLTPRIQLPPAPDPVTPQQVSPEQLEAPSLQLPEREEVPAEELLLPEELKPKEPEQQRRTFLKPPAPLPEEDPDMLLDPGEGSLEDSSPSDLGSVEPFGKQPSEKPFAAGSSKSKVQAGAAGDMPLTNDQNSVTSPAPLPPIGTRQLPAVAPNIAPEGAQLPQEPPVTESTPIEKSLDERIEEQLGPKVPVEEMLLEEADGGLQLSPDEADELLRMNDVSARRTSVPSLLPAQYRAGKETQNLQWVARNLSQTRELDWISSSSASYRSGPIHERSHVIRREVQRRSIYLRP